MNDFDRDNLQKKRIARNARYQKNGRRSTKCTLPSDYLTESQRRKMNGEIMTYKLTSPISWAEFKSYPEDIQSQYLKHFAEKHGATASMMAEMFGTTRAAVSAYIGNLHPNLKGILCSGANREIRTAFAVWLRNETGCSNDIVAIEECEATTLEEAKAEKNQLPEMPYVNTITSGTITVDGRAMDIGQTLYRMFNAARICATVSFKVQKDEAQS